MGLRGGERSLAERGPLQWRQNNGTEATQVAQKKTMKLNPEIDGDETMKYDPAPFLAGGGNEK